jgi:hypothetical protein
VRSKRFALVLDDGIVTHVAVDEGSLALEATSAEAILDVLKAQSPAVTAPVEGDGAALLGLALAGAAAFVWAGWPFPMMPELSFALS